MILLNDPRVETTLVFSLPYSFGELTLFTSTQLSLVFNYLPSACCKTRGRFCIFLAIVIV
jgi:hypothetical protein